MPPGTRAQGYSEDQDRPRPPVEPQLWWQKQRACTGWGRASALGTEECAVDHHAGEDADRDEAGGAIFNFLGPK